MQQSNKAEIQGTRKHGIIVALIPIVAMMFLLIIGYGMYHIEPQVLLISAAFLTGCLGLILRFKWDDMQKGIVDSIVNVHIGKGERKLSFLEKITSDTEIPITQFVPTHIGKSPGLFAAAMEYAKKGGLIDLTTSTPKWFSEEKEGKCSQALKVMLDNGVPVENISFSSDGQGSLPKFDENGQYIGLDVGRVTTLYESFRDAVRNENIAIEVALKAVTSNPARNLKLDDKGGIGVGKDADMVLLDKDMEIDTVIAKGQIMVRDKQAVVKGTFED